jgi:hypothetical protein
LIDKEIPTEDMMMKILASHPSSCVTSWQPYDINGYTYFLLLMLIELISS